MNKTDIIEWCMERWREFTATAYDGQPASNDTLLWEQREMLRFCEQNWRLCDNEKFPYHFGDTVNYVTWTCYGVISPLLSVITLVINCLVCVILQKPHMRSPTNVILLAMATADLLTGACPTPLFVYIYTLRNWTEWPSCGVKTLYNTLNISLPTIFHTASIWLTVTLAAQRYIYLRGNVIHPTSCINVKNLIICSLAIYVIAFLSHTVSFFDFRYQPVRLPSLVNRGQLTDGCFELPTILTNTAENEARYRATYTMSRAVCMHLLPCISLVALNLLLLLKIRESQRRRHNLTAGNQTQTQETRTARENRRTTLMLMFVVALFLFVELPLAVLYLVEVIGGLELIQEFNTVTLDMAFTISNTLILLSYPINFVLYCVMSRQFRQTFFDVFGITARSTCTASDGVTEQQRRHNRRYMSLTVDCNGRTIHTTNDTML